MLLKLLFFALVLLPERYCFPFTVEPSQRSTLFLVTEGRTITHSDLVRWAGNDWQKMVCYFDSEGDGITVSPLLAGHPDRETIIDGLIQRVRKTLAPYGIEVVRHAGAVVEGKGATTIFLGRSTLSNGYHIASDIDYLNDNFTDIAFVGDEDWGTEDKTTMALADVAQHEAGHTFGLHHVNCFEGGVLHSESMGLRYSTSDQSAWPRETRFPDHAFPEYLDHGSGNGPQNAHRTMLSNFKVTRTGLSGKQEPRTTLNALLGCSTRSTSLRKRPVLTGDSTSAR